MRHILLLTDRDWTHPQGGGTGANLFGQVAFWLEWGYRVTVVAGTYEGAEPVSRPAPGLELHHMGSRVTVFPRAAWAVRRGLAADDDRGAFVEADAEHLRVHRHDLLEIVLTIARQHVLIDRHAFDQAEAFFVAGRHHDEVVLARAADHVRRQNRRAGRRPGDHAVTLEHPLDLALGPGMGIGVDQSPLSPADEPDDSSRGDRTDEGL